MKVKNLHSVEGELGHDSTVAAWTFFKTEDFLSDVTWFNDNLVQPGVAIEPHQHVDVEEVYYILEGKGEVEIGEERRPVSQGDAIYLPPRKTHTLKNTGTYPLRFICIGAKVKG